MAEAQDWLSMKNEFKSLTREGIGTDLEDKCLRLCQKYLMGNWTKLTIDELEIKRLTGGMMNMVYHCKIPVNKRDIGTEPKEVAIRLYGLKFDFKTLEVTDNTLEGNIKYMILSEAGIGPKVYGVDHLGLIQKYYQHRHLVESDLYDKSLMEMAAIKLARMHAMKPPIDKTRAGVGDIVESCNRLLSQKLVDKRKLFAQFNCQTLLECDLKAETDWILDKIKTFDSPIVFGHGDFRFCNIMVTEDKQLILSDFDTSCYFYRGFDFSTFFNEFLKLDENSFGFTDESVVKYFIDRYLTECAIINGKQYLENKCNTIEHILKETKDFSLFYSALVYQCMIANEVFNFPIDVKSTLQVANSEVEKFLKVKTLLAN